MSSLLNIGLSGVNAAQGHLVTTSHNIANADTNGYHRQRLIQSAQDGWFSGAGFFGNGTRMVAVTRAYDQFLENQVLSAGTQKSAYSVYAAQISQIDNLLADPTAGLSPAMDAFFAGMQEVASNPTSTEARQALLSSAQALTGRFNSLDTYLNEIREGVEYDIRSTVEQINTYAKNIAELNQRIVVAQAGGAGTPANDLLDQRWQLISELNNLVGVNTSVHEDGTLSVYIGSGQTLVQGNTVAMLAAVQGKADPQSCDIALLAPNGTEIVLPERLFNGGQLAGLLDFRSESLNATQNRLGMIAVSLASAFNNQHKLGVDLEGALGMDFFSLSAPRVIPSGALTVAFDFDASNSADDIASLGQFTDSDYELRYDGTNYTLVNLNTKASKTLSVPNDTFEGLRIDLSASTMTAGQTALIQPTRCAARDISVAVTDPRKVAAGCPVIGDVPVGNTGDGKLSGIVMSDVSGALTTTPYPWNVELSFSGGSLTLSSTPGGFSIANADGSTPATYNPSADAAGKVYTVTGPGGFTFNFTFSGTPGNGDKFSLRPTEAGIADSRNANLLGALQNTKLLFNGGSGPTATLGMAYSQLVNKVGNKTKEVQAGEQAQTALYTQACEARDSLSAVNLDEEAANLIRYQQAYQASGRVMSIAQRLFDEIISIAR
ncbi:MAG: flagellar hook-associated protein FlgK [Azoarcus sp.]|jgi:flagellar hook-associated protein 1 FlgK|nr:flagellar hook-associated protein FlgK [Azoarcus sp.]